MPSLFAIADSSKVPLILAAYLFVGPLLGLAISHTVWGRRLTLGTMIFLTGLFPTRFTLSLGVIDGFRGHTRGFEFSLIEVLAIALIVAALIRHPSKFKWLPPGLAIYLLHCFVCLLTVFTTPYEPFLVAMAALKFTKAALIFVGAYHYLREEGDIRFAIHAIALTLLVQCGAAGYDRYVHGRHRVWGWFEHENSLAMWTYSLAFPVLAASLSKRTRWIESFWLLGAWAAAGIIVILTVSRGAIAAYGAGSLLILGGSLLAGFTKKRLVIASSMAIGGIAIAATAMDTVIARFKTSGDKDPIHNLRLILDKISSQMLADEPFGVGWNNFAIANSRPVPTYSQMLEDWSRNRGHDVNLDDYTANPLTESLYWCILAETGYLGFATYALFLILTFWWCWRNIPCQRDSLLSFVLFGIGVTLFVNYGHSQLERILTQTKNLSMWLIFLGFAAKAESLRRATALRTYPFLTVFFHLFGRPAPSPAPIPAPAKSPSPSP